ncbi:hypothetical protein Z951_34290 [Streptomyces sp. PRh5]|uniref:LysM peptidoglycan-binding domain-containing protein n=1 Tax=Streptomyces sp. PRh5 TaxID=1158056 RepID=UPI00044D3A78|nr:LysM domain-containing protein [Streptomyces sp. PRh5]EXU63791.1 hypothetical protein Z951_34290 [Streptomyces sp. PRh5]
MTPQDIYAAFDASVQVGALTGDSPTGLAALLHSLSVPRLTVLDGSADLGPDSAWCTGRTTYLGTEWMLRLTGTPLPGTDRVSLVLELTAAESTAPWTFETAFPALPRSRRPAATSGGLILGPSVLGPLILERPTIDARNDPASPLLQLRGTLPMHGDPSVADSDALARYADFLGDRLYLDGTVKLSPGEPPVLDLRAVAPGVRLDIAHLEVSAIGVTLTTTYPDPAPLPDPGAPLSAVLMWAETTLPTSPAEVVTVSGPLLIGDHVWPLQIDFDTPLGLDRGVEALVAMTGGVVGDFALPSGIAAIDRFGLTSLGVGITPLDNGPSLSYVTVGIQSQEPWDPPVPYLTIDKVSARWAFFFDPGGAPLVTCTVFGTMRFGEKRTSSLGAMAPYDERFGRGLPPRDGTSDIVVTVELSLPDLAFSAHIDEPFDVPFREILDVFFGGDADLPLTVSVDSLSVYASLLRKEFEAGLNISAELSIPAGSVTLALTGLELQVHVSQAEVRGLVQGKGQIAVPGDADNPITLLVQAQYPGTGAWEFGAIMVGTLDLPRLVYGLLGTPPADWVGRDFDITLADLGVLFSTAPGNPYSAHGTLSVSVGAQLLGMTVKLLLTAHIERRLASATPETERLAVALRDTAQVGPETVTTGSLSGTFTVNKFTVTASVSVADAGKDYTFGIAYGDLSLRAATSWVSDPAPRHQILTVRLTGTLGELLTRLVALVNPNATLRLDPPWDFLNTVDLSGLTLTIDPTAQKIAVSYGLELHLPFVTITSVGLSYDNSSGRPAVTIVLAAQLPGDAGTKPLVWDPVNQAPPQPPGLGDRLVSLRYLGLGQHVSPTGLTRYTSVSEVVDALVAAMRPVDPAAGKPPIDPAVMAFDPAGQWLLGLDVTFMDTAAVKLVMHDPDLYGILVALSGPRASSLAGLSVELLYRKVTDDIGVFHARLQIPDAFRTLQFGAVSVTLGLITVDIYTNGNFRVDLGFPANRNFTDSFAIEAGIFNGRGGIYFGLLSGATSRRVPAITNGTFSPVIELGVGLSIGVGRTFERGPLKAGMYVNLVVIVEGALAWFHPDDGSQDTDLFYWCRGTVGIVGQLYGSVDFKIISVELHLEIAAMATVELAAHRATVVALELSLRASASVKIVFITISFSFSLTLETSFTIGTDSTPPWQLAPGAAARRLAAARAPALAAPPAAEYRLRFDPEARVFPDGQPRTAHLMLVPAFTVANVPVGWTGTAAPPNDHPDHRIVVMLVTDNAVAPGATRIADALRPDVSRNPRAAAPADTSFNQLAEGLLRWSLNALGITSPTAVVTLTQLSDLVEQLSMPEAANTGFTWAALEGFLTNNLHLVVTGTPAGGTPAAIAGTPFPMLPVLRWTSTGLPDPGDHDRDFTTHQPVDATYEAEAVAYFAELDPRPPQDRPSARARLAAAADDGSESMATFVARDHFHLVARAAAQAAVNLLSAYPYQVSGNETLRSIAERFPTATTAYQVAARDGVEVAASHLGVTSGELLAHNPSLPDDLTTALPGDEVRVTVAVTAESIAVANPDWPVAPDRVIDLRTLRVQTSAGQTLAGLARDHQTDLTALLGHLRASAPLLRAGAIVPLPGLVHAGLSVDDAGAVFYIRLGKTKPDEVPLAHWYQQEINRLNGDPPDPLPENTTLTVPARFESTATTTWTSLPGDTVLDVAAYLALGQNVVSGTPFEEWLRAVRAVNTPPDPNGVRLPYDADDPSGPRSSAAVILPNDALASLRVRLLLPQEAFDAYVQDADVLVPLVTVEVPDAHGTTAPGQTLLTLAQRYGLALDDLAGRIADDAGVLAAAPERRLTVPDVPALELDDLVTTLHGSEEMTTVSGQVARSLLSGLRLPAPEPDNGTYHATGPMTGLYQLVGQQVTGPPPPSPPQPPATEPEPPLVTITVEKAVDADWLTFADSLVSDATIALAGETDNALLSITADDLRDQYPATGLAPVVTRRLSALPLSRDTGVRHAVTQVIPWQTTTDVTLPASASATPTLWPLPADLIARAGQDTSASAFLLEQTTPQTGARAAYTELRSYAWATLVPFTVRRVPGTTGTVEVFGADTSDRQRIALLLEYLRAVADGPVTAEFPQPPDGEKALLTLAWQLPPTPGRAPGLTSMPVEAFIVQANLSTETRSGAPPTGRATAEATAGKHFASLTDSGRFLTLLWECSVVGGGGYWLRYRGDVPDSIFDQDGRAQFWMLVQLVSQSGTTPDRHLYAFTNVAVVGDGVDPASVALAARAVDPPELRPAATVEPGRVGFTACLENPSDDDTPQGRLRRLYGLLGFQLDQTEWFWGSGEGRPVSPRPPHTTDELGMPAATEETEAVWELTRIVDISRFAPHHTDAVPTAPPPEGDPYAGIAADAATRVSVWFDDVFGNRSGTSDQVVVPVRYTDPVIGAGAWPSTTVRYTVEGGEGTCELVVSVDFQTIAYQPGPSDPGARAAAVAASGRDELVPVHYQLARPDIGAVLLTSLHQAPGADPTPLIADVEVLRRYVIGAHALLDSLSGVTSATADGTGTLDALCVRHGVDFDTLAAANADTAIARLVDTTGLTVPVSRVFRNGYTIAALCAALSPSPDPAQVLRHEDNTVLPLNPGIELATPPRERAVPADSSSAGALAAAFHCTPARLVAANQDRPGLLTPGFVFECNGLRVAVDTGPPGSEATLAGVAGAFQANGVPFDAARIIALNADTPGMFRPGALMVVDGYVVVGGDTLDRNGAFLTPADLAPLNTRTADLFPPGTPVFLMAAPAPEPGEDTLAHFAAANGTTPGELLRHNRQATVHPASPPVVPGTWAWPDGPAALRVPYTVRPGDSLDAIAERFPGADLVALNADMPGTVAADVTITVGGTSVTTTRPTSFSEVCARFTPPIDLAALATAIGPRTDVPATGALLICPPGVLPAATPGLDGVVPEEAARRFGVTAAALLAANAGTPGLLLPQQVLFAPPATGQAIPSTETTAVADTLTAVVERFRRQGATADIDTLVRMNAGTGFLRAGARVVVPPATARLTGRLGQETPQGVRWSFPATVFPVTVELELSRDPALVDPALAGTATRHRTAVPAERSADLAQDGARSLTAFAAQVQTALPVLRLATGQAGSSATDVWAVVFGADGIEEVSVSPPVTVAGTAQPRAFALRPLHPTLISRQDVTTRGLDVRTGLLTDPQTRDYQGIDLEVWARGFLADVELVLSAASVGGAYAVNREALDRIADTKGKLAAAVAHGLDSVLDGQAPGTVPATKREAAVETLRQELLVSLTRGYSVAAVLQYDTCASTRGTDLHARLSGTPVIDVHRASSDPSAATLSSGKIPLSGGKSQVDFLLTVPDAVRQSALDLALDFTVKELEFGITPQIEGYERSDWLTFLTPLHSGRPAALHFDLGEPRVPVPLRAYPPMPILLGHRALVPTSASQLDDAVRWRYQFSLQHQSVAQDTIEFRVAYNQSAQAVAATQAEDLFAALAQYTTVATGLRGLLAGLRDREDGDTGQDTTLATALNTFDTLAAAVADAWTAHWNGDSTSRTAVGPSSGDGPAADVYRYAINLQTDAEGGWYTTLRLTRAVESGPGGVDWPDTLRVIADGERHDLGRVDPALCGCDTDSDCLCYAFPADTVPALTLLTYELTFPPVHIASYQNASASAWVTRNARLLGPDGPDTAPSFVYRTPETGYPKPIVPFIDITEPIPIGPWSEEPLAPVFRTVFGGDPADRRVSVGMRYAYTLVPGAPPLVALLPVAQSTVGTYDSTTITGITTALDAWLQREQPTPDGGAWAFRLSLHSSLDPSLQRPVLHLRHLSSPLTSAAPSEHPGT